MPCNSGMGESYSGNGGYDHEARRQVEKLTRVSCDIMKAIEELGVTLPVSSETAIWWESHKAHDAQREALQKARDEQTSIAELAIRKLTPEERKALGITR